MSQTIVTRITFDGTVPEQHMHRLSQELERLRSASLGIYANCGSSGDSGQQEIFIAGSHADADALAALLTANGLTAINRHECPDLVLADGSFDVYTFLSRAHAKMVEAPEPRYSTDWVDYPHADDTARFLRA